MAAVPQNPSPMRENTRAHERIVERPWRGEKRVVTSVAERDIEVYVPEDNDGKFALWVHFHGASFIARHALQCATRPRALACVNMGVGSAAYEVPFAQEGVFARLLAAVKESSGSWHGL